MVADTFMDRLPMFISNWRVFAKSLQTVASFSAVMLKPIKWVIIGHNGVWKGNHLLCFCSDK